MKRKVEIKIYSCYWETYSSIVDKVTKLLYQSDFYNIDFCICKEDISDDGKRNIQSQRSLNNYTTRIIRYYENGVLNKIVGFSNTNYDKDRKLEFDNGQSNKNEDKYGQSDYHANTYLWQGINKIIQFYFDNIGTAELYFYLLDTDKGRTYPNNLFNCLSYRELETIGFKILNIDEIDFSNYENHCRSRVNTQNLIFPSFNKYINDIAHISKRNAGNVPSYLVCDEIQTLDENGDYVYTTERYKYTFKSLSAQGYDSLIRCWCMKKLADKEGKDIEFILGRQYFAFDEEELKIANKLTGPIVKLFEEAGLNLEYLTNDDFMNEIQKADSTYERYKINNELRNQTLFRNNIRKKGIPTECAVCGVDNPVLLDAAHIWEVNSIKASSANEINNFIKINNLYELIDRNSRHKDEVFFKKYSLVNSGENGVWLCKNHHKLFDSNYYCFDSSDGKILLHFEDPIDALEFSKQIEHENLDSRILTNPTKAFLSKRQLAIAI